MLECLILLRQLIDRCKCFLWLLKDTFDRKHLREMEKVFLGEHMGMLVYKLIFWTPVSEYAAVLPQKSMCQTEFVCDSEPQIASMLLFWYVSGIGFCHLFGTDAGRYVNSALCASYGARCAYAFSPLTQSCHKRSQTTSKDWVCPLV